MSEQTKQLAEKIARLLENNSDENNFEFLNTEIGKINDRLEKIENSSTSQTQHSAISIQHSPNHPSQNRFVEMLADEIIEKVTNEKACPYEPAGKPCDNCSMCSSLGY